MLPIAPLLVKAKSLLPSIGTWVKAGVVILFISLLAYFAWDYNAQHLEVSRLNGVVAEANHRASQAEAAVVSANERYSILEENVKIQDEIIAGLEAKKQKLDDRKTRIITKSKDLQDGPISDRLLAIINEIDNGEQQ